MRLGTFMDDVPQKGPVIVENGKTDHIIYFSGEKGEKKESSMEFYSSASGKADRHMEPFLVEVDIHDGSDYELSSHEGEEFIYILQGEVEIIYGQEIHYLKEGDSIYYDSIVPHHLHTRTKKRLKYWR